MLVVNAKLKIPLREFRFQFARSSGPGGQNVNKVNTKAELRWNVVLSGSLPDPVRRRLLAQQRRRITSQG
jgi:ribosome-associated protein